MKLPLSLLLLLAFAGWACQPSPDSEGAVIASRPNIVYLIADDLGYGDLSCLGQTHFFTPNIDRLAANGMLFTQHYAGATVCAPSRSALMTGQHTGHTPIRGNRRVQPEGQQPLPATAITVAEVLKQADYVNGAFGKWGLGFKENEGHPLDQGFDAFYGYYCQSLAHRYYPTYLWEDETQVDLANDGTNTVDYAHDLIQEAALDFIEQQQDTNFFLYLPYTIPHAELIVPEDSLLERFRGAYTPEKVYNGKDYGEDFAPFGYCSQDESHAVFAAMVTRLDVYVGQLVEKLESLGLMEQTLFVFTSDNGPHLEGGADPDFFDSNGPFQGYKRDLYEGGIRVPMIAHWPGTIPAGTESDHISAFWDVLPTFAEMAGVPVPEPASIDGISFLPALQGRSDEQPTHDYLYWEFHEQGGKQAVRMGKWKGIRLNVKEAPDGPIELYDLSQDLAETTNLADEHPDVLAKMDSIMQAARVPSAEFPFIASEE